MVSVASWFYVWFNYIINIKIFILLLNNNKSVGKKSFINKNKLETLFNLILLIYHAFLQAYMQVCFDAKHK